MNGGERRAPSGKPWIERFASRVRIRLQAPEGIIDEPALVLVIGLPGSGKSHFTGALSRAVPAVVIRTDEVRKILFRRPTYSPQESGVVYRTSQYLVEEYLRLGKNVIFDGTNLSENGRKTIYDIVERAGARLLLVHVVAPERVIRERLERREDQADIALSDAGWAVYLKMKERFEPIRREHWTIDTSADIEPAVSEIASIMMGSEERT